MQSPIRSHNHRGTACSLHAYSYIQQSGRSVKSMPAKNTKKSPIHENVDANITCDFGDGDISRFRSWLPHTRPGGHIVSSIMLTVAHSCRYYACPGSIAMIVFFHPSRFCAKSGSSWCCLRSLRILSIHLSPGLPRGLFPEFPPTFIVVTCFATFVSSLLIIWPYHERRFWVIYVVIGLTIASLLNFSFLIRSFVVLP